jgi:hypothetical protein
VLAICQSEANPERPPKASARKEDIHSSSPMAGPRPRSDLYNKYSKQVILVHLKSTIPPKKIISVHLKIIPHTNILSTPIHPYTRTPIHQYTRTPIHPQNNHTPALSLWSRSKYKVHQIIYMALRGSLQQVSLQSGLAWCI